MKITNQRNYELVKEAVDALTIMGQNEEPLIAIEEMVLALREYDRREVKIAKRIRLTPFTAVDEMRGGKQPVTLSVSTTIDPFDVIRYRVDRVEAMNVFPVKDSIPTEEELVQVAKLSIPDNTPTCLNRIVNDKTVDGRIVYDHEEVEAVMRLWYRQDQEAKSKHDARKKKKLKLLQANADQIDAELGRLRGADRTMIMEPSNYQDLKEEHKDDLEVYDAPWSMDPAQILALLKRTSGAREFYTRQGPFTTCVLHDQNGLMMTSGVTKCSPQDTFDLKRGQKIALRRALNHLLGLK